MSDLVTGEAVPLELRLAKLPSRALGLLLDAAILAVVGFALLLLFSQVAPGVDEALAAALIIAGTVFLLVVIPTTVETLTRGKSVGKAAAGLRVVRDDGGPIRFRHALVRALAGVFADFVLTLGVGAMVCSLLNSRDKRIGDILAGTVVIRERIPSITAPPPVLDPRLAPWAASLELSRLPDQLAMAVRSLLARAPQLAPEVRTRLAVDLATEVAAVVSPPPPPGTPPWAYLAAVLAERRRRDTLRYGGPQPPYGQQQGPYPGPPWSYAGQPGPYAGQQPGPYAGQPGPYAGQPGPYAGQPPYPGPSSYPAESQPFPGPQPPRGPRFTPSPESESPSPEPEPSPEAERPPSRTDGGFAPPA
ncbi:RDD family protein [Jiangella ureilytica]|uniref:RDD family protein n=1 Tax=Jiangella ureilytica TaxID=2530374 RepID=UPI00193DEACB|nr:RDD family protein [Jiangella ureilytica]